MPSVAKEIAATLHEARLSQRQIKPLTQSLPQLDERVAYEAAWEGLHLREQAGERRVGYKMGLTSEAKRRQMSLQSPIYGLLTDKMQLASGKSFSMAKSIHPKAEPEVAFHIKKTFSKVPTPEEALEACDWIAPAIEILDSRFEGFKYFSLPDVIADNSSSSHFLIGSPKHATDFRWTELADIPMRFFCNDKLLQEVRASEISGNPIYSLVGLFELALQQRRSIHPNSWILAGAATPAVGLEPGMRVKLETGVFESLDLIVDS